MPNLEPLCLAAKSKKLGKAGSAPFTSILILIFLIFFGAAASIVPLCRSYYFLPRNHIAKPLCHAADGAKDDTESEYIFLTGPARFYLCQDHRTHHWPWPDFAALRRVADPMNGPVPNPRDEVNGKLTKEPPNPIIGADYRNK
jgi:hypothetical protein